MATGYFKRFRMAADLLRIRRPAPLPPAYRFVPWSEALLEVHARTKYHAFRDEIDAVVFPCLGDLEGCRRLMREIREKPGFLPLATWLIVRGDSHASIEWCGTIQGVVDETGAGSIQNIGIVPGHRGLGLGTALIERALAGFRDWGVARATLEVTADNAGAVRLYQRLGFRRQRTVYKVVDGVPPRATCAGPAAVVPAAVVPATLAAVADPDGW